MKIKFKFMKNAYNILPSVGAYIRFFKQTCFVVNNLYDCFSQS